MNWLLYNKGSFISARLLATLLGLKATSNPDKIKDGKLLIRYGNSYGNFTEDTNLNSPDIIRICSDSLRFSKWCLENGFNTPTFSSFEYSNDYDYPFLLREKYHKQGDDIILINKPEDIPEETCDKFHVPFISTDVELGIHLVNGKALKLFKKVAMGEQTSFIRNNKRGYHFKIINDMEHNYKLAQEICENLFGKLGLNFGRVDIAYNSATKRYIIWEVNTAPGLNKLTSEMYAQVLRELINV